MEVVIKKNPIDTSREIVIDSLLCLDESDNSVDINSRLTIIANYLKMITNNLLLDDPGIFYVHIIYDDQERQIQKTFNNWLINQIVYLSTLAGYER